MLTFVITKVKARQPSPFLRGDAPAPCTRCRLQQGHPRELWEQEQHQEHPVNHESELLEVRQGEGKNACSEHCLHTLLVPAAPGCWGTWLRAGSPAHTTTYMFLKADSYVPVSAAYMLPCRDLCSLSKLSSKDSIRLPCGAPSLLAVLPPH